MALFVGIFLILNTFSIIVAQRTRELALMRAIGASRRQVIGSVLVEAVVIGLLASVLGLAPASASARCWPRLRPASAAAGSQLAGLGVPPAALDQRVRGRARRHRAGRADPGAAGVPDPAGGGDARGGHTGPAADPAHRGRRRRARRRRDRARRSGLTGNAGDATLWAILGGVLLAFIGIALLTPLIARPVVGLIGRLFAWSVPGRLGRLNSGRNPRRTAITAAALMVGIALITGVNTVLVVGQDEHHQGGRRPGPRRPDHLRRPDQRGGRRRSTRRCSTRRAELAGVDRGQRPLRGRARSSTASTHVRRRVHRRRRRCPACSASPPTAGQHRASSATDQVVVDETTAATSGPDASAARSPSSWPGASRCTCTLSRHLRQERPASAASSLPVVGGAGLHACRSRRLGFIQVQPGASVASRQVPGGRVCSRTARRSASATASTFLDQQTAAADQVLPMVQILLALAILIAVLGVINTLALSVLERTRELGLLRAIGLGRAQTMRMVTVEAVVISVFGALLGLVVGVGLGAAVVRALHDEGITELALPWTQMVTYLVLAARRRRGRRGAAGDPGGPDQRAAGDRVRVGTDAIGHGAVSVGVPQRGTGRPAAVSGTQRRAAASRSTSSRLAGRHAGQRRRARPRAGRRAPRSRPRAALAMPVGESSIATQSGRVDAERGGRRQVGLRVRLGVLHLVAADHHVEVRPARACAARPRPARRSVLVTSAVGTPAARTAASSSRAPGRQSSPSANSSCTRSSSQAAPSSGSRHGWPRSAQEQLASCRSDEAPSIAARAASDSVPP